MSFIPDSLLLPSILPQMERNRNPIFPNVQKIITKIQKGATHIKTASAPFLYAVNSTDTFKKALFKHLSKNKANQRTGREQLPEERHREVFNCGRNPDAEKFRLQAILK